MANTNAALASARDAADSVAAAAEDFPKLTEDLESLAQKADALISSYGENSRFNTEALDLLRDLQPRQRRSRNLRGPSNATLIPF